MKIAALLLLVVMVAGVAFGAGEDIPLKFPNKRGTVVFAHQKHEKLADDNCKVCHEEEVGVIKSFGKAFAHRVCIGCHEPEAGKVPGPITCEGCHLTS